jgi:hypothetical protein
MNKLYLILTITEIRELLAVAEEVKQRGNACVSLHLEISPGGNVGDREQISSRSFMTGVDKIRREYLGPKN